MCVCVGRARGFSLLSFPDPFVALSYVPSGEKKHGHFGITDSHQASLAWHPGGCCFGGFFFVFRCLVVMEHVSLGVCDGGGRKFSACTGEWTRGPWRSLPKMILGPCEAGLGDWGEWPSCCFLAPVTGILGRLILRQLTVLLHQFRKG